MAMSGPEPSREEVLLDGLHREAINYLLPAINEEVSPGEQKYADVCQYLQDNYKTEDALLKFGNQLRDLYVCSQEAVGILHATAACGLDVLDMVPARPISGSPPLRLQLRLWQMCFSEEASIKGASNLCDILDIIQRDIVTTDGNNTAKYPLEVLFGATSTARNPGEAIEDFCVGLSIGFGTTLAAFLVAKAAIDLAWKDKLPAPDFQVIAPKLIKILHLHCIYDPADTITEQIKKSLGGKIQAASRQRPTTLQMLTCFSRQVNEIMAGSTRKARTTVLAEVVRDYNKQEKIRACKINPDEIAAIRFLSSRGPEFLHLLKVVWGQERTAHTACPLNLLSAGFLDVQKDLPVNAKDNPMWCNILQLTEEKCLMWLRRVHGRFLAKIQETVSKGKAPNLRNYGHMYRDTEPELVWRTVCLFTYAHADLVRLHSAARVKELETMFYRGVLDKDMLDKVRLMDANFAATDLRFVQDSPSLDVQVSTDGQLSAAQREQLLAEFKVFTLKLQAEEATWKRYLAARMEFDDSNQAAMTRFREAAHDAMEKAINAHANTHYNVACLATRSHMLTFLEQSLKTLAESPPTVPASAVLRLNVFNLPMLGQSHSRMLSEICESIRNEAAHHPTTSLSILILPNTSEWGKGMEVNRALPSLVMQARQNVIAKLSEAGNSLTVADCVAMFDVNTMYSKEREVRTDFLCIISSQVDASDEPVSIFARSFLVRRRGVPGLLPVLHRKFFQDWTKAIMVHDHGNLDHTVERRQWFSGSGLFRGILSAVFKDMGLTSATTCQVRDFTPYDDQLALAIMEMNGPGVQASQPNMGYAAGAWKELPGSTHIRANLQASIIENLFRMLKGNTYILPGFHAVGPEPKVDISLRPTILEDSFKICCPRANDELPIRQAFYDQWSANVVTEPLWKDMILRHDLEFNPSGVPFKIRRAADTPLPEVPEANAITIPRDPAGPASKEALLQSSKCQEVQLSRGPCSIIVTEPGEVYVVAAEDTVIDNKEALFVLKGRFKIGQAATALMGQGRAANFVSPAPGALPSIAACWVAAPPSSSRVQDVVETHQFIQTNVRCVHLRR